MGRRRKTTQDNWLPPRVYLGRSAFEFRPSCGGCIRLADKTASKAQVIRRYQEEVKKLEMISGSFEQLVAEYLASPEHQRLAPVTQRDYAGYAQFVLPVFGKVRRNRITPVDIRKYMDLRGAKSITRANREHAFMSAVFSWGIQRKIDIRDNPCKKVNKFTEKPRTRYITDAEYQAVWAQANPWVQAAMEISFCCAARQGDVLQLRRQDLLEEGIYIRQSKTGKEQIKAWTPRLRQAVDLALAQQGDIKSATLIFSCRGGRLSADRLRKWYAQAKVKAQAANPNMRFDFTFHDIKAKAITDYKKGDKREFSGHKTLAQVDTYSRRPDVVETNE